MHYFIEYTNLTQQSATDTFGVESSDPTNKFNITSRFQLTNQAKAFACQDGMMIVQQSDVDATLVNIIIKPIDNLKVNLNNIKYFVYRGILKSSLIVNDNTIIAEAPTNNEFIARLWQDHNHFKTNFEVPDLPYPTPKVFGYDNSLSTNLNIEKIYDNSQEDIQALLVKQGEWFGEFATTHKIGLEIITSNERINIDLAYLKKEKHQIDVTGLTGLELKAKREEILSFIDPSAFWGLHYDYGIKVSTYSGGEKTTEGKKRDELFNLLIDKFHTKNRVYLDVRSEFGYSYNFYQNYNDGTGKNIKIGNSSTASIAENYGMLGFGWPVIAIDNPMDTSNNFNDVVFQLRIDDNTKPILFIEYTELLTDSSRTRFIDDTKLLDVTSTDWSKEIKLKFPNNGSGASKSNIAFYMRLYYHRQETSSSSPNTVITKGNSLDNLFGSLDMLYLGDTQYTFQHSTSEHPTYSKGEISAQEFDGVFRQKANFDAQRIVFTSEMLHSHKTTTLTPYPDTTLGRGNGIDLEGNFNQLSHLKRDMYHSNQTIQEEVSTATYEPVSILGISNYNGFPSRRENLYILGLMQSELTELKNATGLSNLHDRFIVFEDISPTPAEDKDGKPYKKYKLKVQGLDANGIATIIEPTSDVFVYTNKDFMLCSKAFTENEPLDDSTFYERNYEEKIGFENREPSTNKRYEDWFIEKDSGMQVEVDGFINALSQINNDSDFYSNVKALVEDSAEDIWNQAVSTVQANNNANPDDRPLYWGRMKMEVALKSHPYFEGGINNEDLDRLIKLFEEKSRNYTGVDFSNAPTGAKKILITGFDPFFLNEKIYPSWHHFQQWNPSGQAVLSLHGKTIGNGFIQSMIFPVRYIDFDNGYVEKYILEHIQDVDMIITISQGRYRYDIERFASKFRTSSTIDNLNVVLPHKFYLPSTNGISQVNESVIPEFLETTLPINTIIPGSLGNTLVVYNQEYIGNQTSAPYSSPNSGTSNITGPNTTEKAMEGSGGTYLSNEIFYRVAVLRNDLGLNNILKSGHLHVPILTINDLTQAKIDTLNVKTIIQDAIQGL
jgi:pyrrolidone-carboxylate peptidase/ribosomal protein L31